jgi:hypothetical protein
MSCHEHVWLCHLIRVDVDMLTLLKRLLTKKQISMQNVRMEKCLLHLACGNNYEGIFFIQCMILNLIFFMLLCQGLCKRFENICNFQKFWHLFISHFNVKKHMLQCLMSVFESFLFINFFQINSHVPMIYYEPYYIKKTYIFKSKLNYYF